MLLSVLMAMAAGSPVQLAQLTIRERIVIHVAARPAPATVDWREHKGPHCISVADIGGAALTASDKIDFIVRGGSRIRARLAGACPTLFFYGGFYLRPDTDGRVCEKRDAVHARSGGECQIDKFRLLTPKPAR